MSALLQSLIRGMRLGARAKGIWMSICVREEEMWKRRCYKISASILLLESNSRLFNSRCLKGVPILLESHIRYDGSHIRYDGSSILDVTVCNISLVPVFWMLQSVTVCNTV